MAKLVSPSSQFMIGVVFLIHMASLIHLVFMLFSLSITCVPSQSLMQICSVCLVCDCRLYAPPSLTLLFTGKPSCCDVFNLRLVFLESCSKCSPFRQSTCGYSSYKGSGIHSRSFHCLPLCPSDALVFF